ncbi:large subunit ribosomal protein L17 [Daejeonella rubra]|uniref:Large ribosomal subunit protein bL17 n=1 Tax=Daejeonella rubra TaxID=990371 RepID=A0A1G9XF44_9SPHI|nr:50S ribosomal protein L17 [Daejeonella rubra]SDM94885.1 large subunit ribosomal protein L17 [Daejeonella rubra]
MRHGKKVNHLSRTDSHRRAMLANMASSLILHKRITTTLAKAKALRVYVEPIITRSKDDTTHSRRTVFSYLQNKEVVSILFRDIAAKVADRPGGYTRILKMGNRLGDNASMALIELVDYNEIYTSGDAVAEKKTTRRRGSKAKKADDAPAVAAKAAPKAEKEEVVEAVATEEIQAEVPATEETQVEAPSAEETPAEDTQSEEKKGE